MKKAFTLIELLVVIAIISLLVSILLPSIQKAKDLAKRAICSANQRSILLAANVYASDNDGWVAAGTYNWGPWVIQSQSPIRRITLAMYFYGLYLEDFHAVVCPADEGKMADVGNYSARWNMFDFCPGSDGGWAVGENINILSSYIVYSEGWGSSPIPNQYYRMEDIGVMLVDGPWNPSTDMRPIASWHGGDEAGDRGWNAGGIRGDVKWCDVGAYVDEPCNWDGELAMWSSFWANGGSVWNTFNKLCGYR